MKRTGEEAREAMAQMQENLSHLSHEAMVLIIDDNQNDCLLLKQSIMAVSPGTMVHTANTPEEAEQDCLRNSYDLIFLDLIFPIGCGAKMLKSNWIQTASHVVVMTGAEQDSIPVDEARKAGAKVILTKPVDAEVLSLIFRRIPNGKI